MKNYNKIILKETKIRQLEKFIYISILAYIIYNILPKTSRYLNFMEISVLDVNKSKFYQ